MLKKTEAEETIGFFVIFLSLMAFDLGGGGGPPAPLPLFGYAYACNNAIFPCLSQMTPTSIIQITFPRVVFINIVLNVALIMSIKKFALG